MKNKTPLYFWEYANLVMEGLPYGVPIGWTACRLMDGNFKLAAVDLAILPALLLVMHFRRKYL